jgi:hypothetical protein
MIATAFNTTPQVTAQRLAPYARRAPRLLNGFDPNPVRAFV